MCENKNLFNDANARHVHESVRQESTTCDSNIRPAKTTMRSTASCHGNGRFHRQNAQRIIYSGTWWRRERHPHRLGEIELTQHALHIGEKTRRRKNKQLFRGTDGSTDRASRTSYYESFEHPVLTVGKARRRSHYQSAAFRLLRHRKQTRTNKHTHTHAYTCVFPVSDVFKVAGWASPTIESHVLSVACTWLRAYCVSWSSINDCWSTISWMYFNV